MTKNDHRRGRLAVLALLVLLLASGGSWFVVQRLSSPDVPSEDRSERSPSRATVDETPPPEDQPAPARAEVELRGWVVAAWTGKPIAGARLTTQLGDRRQALTDARGRWRLVVSRNEWGTIGHDIRVEASGYLPRILWDFTWDEGSVRLVPAIALTPVAASMSGLTLDDEGKPVPGVEIHLSRVGIMEWDPLPIISDGRGRFGPIPVGAGYLGLSAMKFGWLTESQQVLVLPDDPPAPVSAIFRLARAELIPACVVDETGKPVAGVAIFDLAGPVRATTDARGGFLWPVDESGRGDAYSVVYKSEHTEKIAIWVIVRGAGNRFVLPEMSGDDHLEPESEPEPEAEGPPADASRFRCLVRVRMPDGAPVAGATVLARQKNTWEVLAVVSDARGEAALDLNPQGGIAIVGAEHDVHGKGKARVPPVDHAMEVEIELATRDRDVTIRVRDEHGKPLPDAWAVRDERVDRADAEGIIRTRVAAGDAPIIGAPGRVGMSLIRHIDPGQIPTIVLRREALVLGRIVDAQGRPVRGVLVEGGGWSYDSTDAEGQFLLDGLRPGTALAVTVTPPGLGGSLPGPWIVAGGEEARIVLPAMATVKFRLSAEPGETPLDRVGECDVLHVDRRHAESGKVADLHVPAVRVGDAWIARMPAGRVLVSLELGDERACELLTLGADTETTVELAPPRRRSISGRILGPDGKPVPRAELRDLWSGDLCARTDADGRIVPELDRRGLITTAIVRLCISVSSHAPYLMDPIDLRTEPDLNVRLTRGGTVRVRTLAIDGSPRLCHVIPLSEAGEFLPVRLSAEEVGLRVLEQVPAGFCRLWIRPENRRPIIRTVQVLAGKTTELTVTLTGD
jgi:hypothetical protein